MSAFRATLVGACVLLVARVALGDVVGPPRDIDCPAGSQQTSCHGSEYCAPVRCTDESECDDGEACQTIDLCVYETTCGGWDPTSYSGVDGPCGSGEECDRGTCRSISVCSPTGIFGSPDGGCACRAAPSTSSAPPLGWGVLLAASTLLLAFGLLRRR